jgi:D-glycero-alpha-D-manno-heptose-7-phosphate kinase
VSFIGGGTDMPYFYNKYSGATISCAIDKYIYVTVKFQTNLTHKYRLNYSVTENTN